MTFNERYLVEDKIAVKRLYPSIPDTDFMLLLNLDPTYREDSDSVGKYSKWLCNLYKRGARLDEYGDLVENGTAYPNVKDNLAKFDDLKSTLQNRDINQFKTYSQFYDTVKELSEDNLSDRQKERRTRNAYKDTKLLFSDDKYEVWTPTTYAGSCTLGKGTTWCTAYSENDKYYRDYSSRGTLYVIIDKHHPDSKFQFHFETGSFVNEEDEEIVTEDDDFKIPDALEDDKLIDFFKPMIDKSSVDTKLFFYSEDEVFKHIISLERNGTLTQISRYFYQINKSGGIFPKPTKYSYGCINLNTASLMICYAETHTNENGTFFDGANYYEYFSDGTLAKIDNDFFAQPSIGEWNRLLVAVETALTYHKVLGGVVNMPLEDVKEAVSNHNSMITNPGLK